MLARIYKPSKTAMQSGMSGTKKWVLEYDPASAREVEPLMGWTSSDDMNSQIRLSFETKEAAIAYAQAHNIPHRVIEAKKRKPRPKAYADNFAYNRVEPWTH